MTKVDYKRIEELYKTLSSIENSGDDVLSDIKKEINNEELLLLKDEIMPYLAKCIAMSLQQLRCQMDVSIQYDGSGNLSYSFCKSGSNALIRGDIKSEDLVDLSISSDDNTPEDMTTESLDGTASTHSNQGKSRLSKIKVSFPDGRVIQPHKVQDVIVEVVKYAGPERVQTLNIKVCGDNLVLKHPRKLVYATACKPVGGGWLVNTYSTTLAKFEQIKTISERLRLGINVEIINGINTESYHNIDSISSPQLFQDDIVEYSHTLDNKSKDTISAELDHRKLRIVDYSDKSFVLYGDSSGYEKFLEEQSGVYNKYLPEGPGWLFSKKREIVIMDFFKLKNNEDSDKSDLSTLLGQLSQMKTMKNKWIKSPHKAIYLITLICGIRAGHINHRKICLDDYLIQTFKDLWVKYVPIGFPYAMEIGNPFMHLSSEPFYFLHTISDIPDFNIGWSVSAVKRVCDYAYVSDDFRNIIMSDDNTREITKHLINEFGLKGCGDFTLANIQNDQNNTAFSNDATCVPKLPKPKIPNRYGAAMFRLTYPSAAVEESDAFLDVYVNFVKKAGAERVRNLGIYSLGANIIARQEEINIKYKKQYKDIGGGYYFNTISTTQRKYEVMTYISSCLNMGIKVELVAKED